MKLAIPEAESEALRVRLFATERSTTSLLSVVEVARTMRRREPQQLSEAESLLSGFDLIPLSLGLMRAAADLRPSPLRTLDAIHIASAMQLGRELEGIVTYDLRMQEAAEANHIRFEAPGTAS